MTHQQHNKKRAGGAILAFLTGAATAVAIGGYLLYGPRGKQHRKSVERWLLQAKAEILDRMDAIGDVTEDQYHAIVDEVTNRYAKYKHVGSEKAARAAARFKHRWNEMRDAARRAREEAEMELAEDDLLNEESDRP